MLENITGWATLIAPIVVIGVYVFVVFLVVYNIYTKVIEGIVQAIDSALGIQTKPSFGGEMVGEVRGAVGQGGMKLAEAGKESKLHLPEKSSSKTDESSPTVTPDKKDEKTTDAMLPSSGGGGQGGGGQGGGGQGGGGQGGGGQGGGGSP